LSLDDLYKEVILDHYQHPRNRGQLEEPDVATRGHNPLCGDEVLLAVKMDGDVIQDIAFGGRGGVCFWPSSIRSPFRASAWVTSCGRPRGRSMDRR